MISLKNKEQIEDLAKGGAILARVLEDLSGRATVGMTGEKLDRLAQELFQEAGVTPAFLGYPAGAKKPFPAALCVSLNDEVVHGVPHSNPFVDGDIVKLDLGLVYKGLYLDAARTVAVGTISSEHQRLLDVTRKALELGIDEAQVGQTTGDIGAAIQEYVEGEGFQLVRQLVGHGVGFAVHEDPQVPNVGERGEGVGLEEGLVIAIEPMVVTGDYMVMTKKDGWTVATKDGGLAAHEEQTVAVTKEGPWVLTALS